MDQDKPLSESEFRTILVLLINLMIESTITVGALSALLEEKGTIQPGRLRWARKEFEKDPRFVELRKRLAEIQDSASILEFLRNFEGPPQ
jgi:hypothetical protein